MAKTVKGLKESELNKLKKDREKAVDVYAPKGAENQRAEYLKKRIFELKEARKRPLPGIRESWEDKMREADLEFTPHELNILGERKRFESDDELGLRSKLVRIGTDDDWQSNTSSTDFYVKVSTAVSILTDMNPEAVFTPAGKRWAANTKLAYANWKHSWEYSGARRQVKYFTFNLAKYGFAVGKTYPRILETKKKIWSVEKDDYEEKRLVKYNDLFRKNLNPWSVWISDMATPGDYLSVNDWYHEVDYDYETFKAEFPESEYPNASLVKPGMTTKESDDGKDGKEKMDKITVGFYENQISDNFDIWIPATGIVLHSAPLPNDDGNLSLWFAPWSIRDDRSIYGIGIFEIIRNDKAMYDKLSNMTMDQLMLSIYKMFFHKGVDVLGENGTLRVVPGKGEQVMDPASVTWMNVPGPGNEAWKGLEYQKALVDDASGVPMQLSGTFAGRTLGQDMQSKETALQRMKAPLDFICDALEQEAYVSLSWTKQIYSTPELLEWSSPEDLKAALKEWNLTDEEIQAYLSEVQNPREDGLVFQEESPMGNNGEDEMDEEGNPVEGKKYAKVYKETSLNLNKDDKGELYESENQKFYRFGVDLSVGRLDWKGVVKINPQSVLRPSKELTKRNDLDLFNLVFPSIQAMAQNPMMVPVLMPPIKQVIKSYEKDVGDWIDEKHFDKMFQDASTPKEPPPPEVKSTMSVSYKDIALPANEAMKQTMEKYYGIKIEDPLFVDASTGMGPQEAMMQAAMQQQGGGMEGAGGEVNPKEGVKGISPVADMKPAPTTIGGAVEGSTNMV